MWIVLIQWPRLRLSGCFLAMCYFDTDSYLLWSIFEHICSGWDRVGIKCPEIRFGCFLCQPCFNSKTHQQMGLIWWKPKWCRLMLHVQKHHLQHQSSLGASRAHRKLPWISVTTTNLRFARYQRHPQQRHLQHRRHLQIGRHLFVPLLLRGNPRKRKVLVWACGWHCPRGNKREMWKPARKARDPKHSGWQKRQLQKLHLSECQKTKEWKKGHRRRCQTRRHHDDRNTIETIVSVARAHDQNVFQWLLWCSKEAGPCATLDWIFWCWHTWVRIERPSVSGARTSFRAGHGAMWLEQRSSDMFDQQQRPGDALVWWYCRCHVRRNESPCRTKGGSGGRSALLMSYTFISFVSM